MMQLPLGRQMAFELHPVKPLDLPLAVGLDKGVQFAIRNPIKDSTICANVPHRFRKFDPDHGIALRDACNLSLRTGGFERLPLNLPFSYRCNGAPSSHAALSLGHD
jgi:hypothetical protein